MVNPKIDIEKYSPQQPPYPSISPHRWGRKKVGGLMGRRKG